MNNTERPILKCTNGRFAGYEKEGVSIFKGIPYAKPPVGDLRWRPPQRPDDSDELFDAVEFGPSGIQQVAYSESGSQGKMSEDCLSLNVWVGDMDRPKKPIMFYIHGGGFAYGGSADPFYDGEYFVREHQDVVIVSTNYRIGIWGFLDLRGVPGGEDYPEGPYIAVLDLIQSLKWVHENADSFGGDADNITIFGESAGGNLVSSLLVCDGTEGLFKRVIAHSGTLNLLHPEEKFAKEAEEGTSIAQCLAAKTGAKCVADMVALSAEELFAADTEVDEETGISLNEIYQMPLKGGNGPIPADPYKALEEGKGKDVDFMIGTVADEWRYWILLMNDIDVAALSKEEHDKIIEEDLVMYEQFVEMLAQTFCDCITDEEKAQLDEFLKICRGDERKWKVTELLNEVFFRIPSIEAAYRHALGGGKTYMYRFDKKAIRYEWMGAAHACEVPYAFNNVQANDYMGEMNPQLALDMSTAWANFARNGDPSIEKAPWKPYDPQTRDTMIFGDDGSMTMEQDPWKKQRELAAFAYKYMPL